jgi:hypothetical protein
MEEMSHVAATMYVDGTNHVWLLPMHGLQGMAYP